jgi:hypothetical protein
MTDTHTDYKYPYHGPFIELPEPPKPEPPETKISVHKKKLLKLIERIGK